MPQLLQKTDTYDQLGALSLSSSLYLPEIRVCRDESFYVLIDFGINAILLMKICYGGGEGVMKTT